MPRLHGDESVVNLDLLREEVRPDGRLVLVAELLVHVPVGAKARVRNVTQTRVSGAALAAAGGALRTGS